MQKSAMLCLFTSAMFGVGGVGVVGCGGGGGSTGTQMDAGTQAPTPLTEAQFETFAQHVVCAFSQACGEIGAGEEKQCETLGASYVGTYSLADAIAAGRLTFDGAAAAACAASFTTPACDLGQLITFIDGCVLGSVHGQVAIGGTCADSAECKAGFCKNGAQSGCSGTCVAFAAVGAVCMQSSDCGPDAGCNNGTCVALAAAGAACNDSSTCKSPMICRQDMSGANGVCGDAGKAGDACSGMSQENCESAGVYCDTTANKCKARPVLGAACTQNSSCAGGLPCVGSSFTAGGTCAAWLDAGAACDDSGGVSGCPYDMTCKAKVCVPTAKAGDDCSTNTSVCTSQSNLYCEPTSKTCKARIAFGDACVPPDPNGGDNPCHDGVCDITAKKCVLMCM